MASDHALITEDEFMVEFIKKYRQMECLWKTSHEDYAKKHRRMVCLVELLKIMKKREPDADINKVKRKINSMRCNFNKQHKRVMKGMYSMNQSFDDSETEYFIQRMRYYNLLTFLNDRNPIKKRKKKVSGKEPIYLEDDQSNEETHLNKEYLKEDLSSSDTSSPITSPKELKLPNNYAKRRKTADSRTLDLSGFNHQADETEASSIKPLYSAFGEHVAEKLRCMPKPMTIYCQKIINDAIFQAEIGDLNKNSHIVTDKGD